VVLGGVVLGGVVLAAVMFGRTTTATASNGE